ncbi:CAP domain-containing protein [Streptomyces pratens]|uniref:CAP domain-containing protein n=1 Tax=Streptomyces pratens TaxID=887456 RepID=A0ABW1LT93_9ACTN
MVGGHGREQRDGPSDDDAQRGRRRGGRPDPPGGHRANILKPDFTHIGVGFAGGGRAGTYWTQLFGA